MTRRRIRSGLALCGFLLAVAAPAVAQTVSDRRDEPNTPRIDVTPFVAMGSVFASRWGASIAFGLTPRFSLEVEAGYGRCDAAALNVSASLIYDLPALGRVTPYAAAGVGLEHYSVPLELPRLGVVTQRRLGFATNLGGGVKVPVTTRWMYRSDVRWLTTQGGGEGWRLYNGASFRVGR